ncbi:MAG: lysophospholipid acyltransferase family protein [Arenicellales bacterium]|nr:lysophospholipid acyltransferase family protein [Arenicellales bacterium]
MSLLLTLLSRLPLGVLYGFAYVVYFVLYSVIGLRKQVVVNNLANSFPQYSSADIKRLASRFYRNYSDVVVEMVKSISMAKQDLVERVHFDNLEVVQRELGRGQPVLVTLAHHGNIEWLLLTLCCKLGYPMEAIYRPLANPAIEKTMTKAYTRFGGKLIDDRSVIKEIMARKTQPRIVAIASDQAPNINDQKVWLDFLNQETAFFLAPDTIARFVNYPVYYLTMWRTSRGYYRAAFRRIAEPPYVGKDKAIIKAYIAEVERQILESPEDWLWIHNRWKRKKPIYNSN